MSKLTEMLSLAATAHDGQFDKAGVPYIFHIMSVAEYTRQRWGHEDEDLLCIAIGHDLMEDAGVLWQDLADHFGFRIANGILKLSKFKGQTYEEYQRNVLSSFDAMRVKLCDLRHNMMEGRVIMDAKTERRMLKYRAFRDTIEERLSEIGIS